MRLTGSGIWGPPADVPGAVRVLRRAVERGVRLIDTADAYGPGHAENLIARALRPYPDGLLVATKGGFIRTDDRGWRPAGRPEQLRRACEASLRRLRVDCIDIYQLHTPDPDVPIEDSVGALDELRHRGKIRHLGVSNVSAEQLAAACRVAPVAVVQNRLNFDDHAALAVLRRCAAIDLPFLAYRPLNDAKPTAAFAAAARERGLRPATLALVWLRALSDVVVPIPGTRRIDHLEENLGAGDVSIDAGLRDWATGMLTAADGTDGTD
jgi:aryl-alcohol dehydrogenase-like predicted oxidoreductase